MAAAWAVKLRRERGCGYALLKIEEKRKGRKDGRTRERKEEEDADERSAAQCSASRFRPVQASKVPGLPCFGGSRRQFGLALHAPTSRGPQWT
jgi:hypothetical protein